MPATTTSVASKLLAQKWEAEKFRTHRLRVSNALSSINNVRPREFPHIKLAINKLALQEEKLARYERENQMLLGKIKIIVKGRGTIDNWNAWSRKDLHAPARSRRQREIELQNQAMLKRLQAAKPVVQRTKQENDFKKHKRYQGIMESGAKDYKSPRAQMPTAQNVDDTPAQSDEKDEEESPETERSGGQEEDEVQHEEGGQPDDETSEPEKRDKDDTQEQIKKTKSKTKSHASLPENKKKNRQANVPKLPPI